MVQPGELLAVAPYTRVDANQLFASGLPDVREIHFMNGAFRVNSTAQTAPQVSSIGLYAADVSHDAMQEVLGAQPGQPFEAAFNSFYGKSGLTSEPSVGNDSLVAKAWRTRQLEVITPVTFPNEDVPGPQNLPKAASALIYYLSKEQRLPVLQKLQTFEDDSVTETLQQLKESLGITHTATLISLGYLTLEVRPSGMAPPVRQERRIHFPPAEPPQTITKAPANNSKKPAPPQALNTADIPDLDEIAPQPDKDVPPPAADTPLSRKYILQEPPAAAPEVVERTRLPEIKIDTTQRTASVKIGSAKAILHFGEAIDATDISVVAHELLGYSAVDNGDKHALSPKALQRLVQRARLQLGLDIVNPQENFDQFVDAGHVSYKGLIDVSLQEMTAHDPFGGQLLDDLLAGRQPAEVAYSAMVTRKQIDAYYEAIKQRLGIAGASNKVLRLALYASRDYRSQQPELCIPTNRLVGESTDYRLELPAQIHVTRRTVSDDALARHQAPMWWGPRIHWGGGVFEAHLPPTDMVRQYGHFLVLSCFDLDDAGLAATLHASRVNASRIKNRLKTELGLYEGYSSYIHSLFDREWLRVLKPMSLPEMTIAQGSVALLQGLRRSNSFEDLQRRNSASLITTSKRLSRCKETFGVSTTQGLMTACYGLGIWKPARDLEAIQPQLQSARNEQ